MVDFCEEKPHQTPLGPKIPIQGCSEEWKFEAEAPEGIAEERSSVFFGEKDRGRFFLVWENTQKKSEKVFGLGFDVSVFMVDFKMIIHFPCTCFSLI